MTSGKTNHGAKLQQAKARAPQFRQQRSLRDRLHAHAEAAEAALRAQPHFALSRPSTSDRYRNRVAARISHGSMTSNLPVPGQAGQILICDSRLERDHALCLMFHPSIRYIEEQVGFNWCETPGGNRPRNAHFFDLLTLGYDGRVTAWSVRPLAKYYGSTLSRKLPVIAEQAISSGQADDVRLLTDADRNRPALEDARLVLSVREADPEADTRALDVMGAMTVPARFDHLTAEVGLGLRGRDALLRLIGLRKISLHSHGLEAGTALLALSEGF